MDGDCAVDRKDTELEDGEMLYPDFFMLLKGRKNDHSDSNWTESNSDVNGE